MQAFLLVFFATTIYSALISSPWISVANATGSLIGYSNEPEWRYDSRCEYPHHSKPAGATGCILAS